MISKVKLSAPATLIFSAIAIYKKKANKRKKVTTSTNIRF